MKRIYSMLSKENCLTVGYHKYQLDYNLVNIKKIYNEKWEEECITAPYVALTQLIDSYIYLITRPDLAFLYCWEAINNTYNELIMKNTSLDMLTDTKGLNLFIDCILSNINQYEYFITPYLNSVPMKLYRYVSNYIIKGYVLLKFDFSNKYINSSHNTFKKRFEYIYEVIGMTYGDKLLSLSNPSEDGKLNSDPYQTRMIINSLSYKIKELIETGTTTIHNADYSNTFTLNITNHKKIEFLIFQILYASRCNNFHGNVASRLNGRNSNQESYNAYKYVYLTAHMFLGIGMHINGYIDDAILNTQDANRMLI